MVITVFLILKYTGVKYGRDEKWKEETIKNTSETQFRTEFECEFLGSIDTLISASKLRVLSHNPPIQQNKGLDIYEEVKQDHHYVVTVDVGSSW